MHLGKVTVLKQGRRLRLVKDGGWEYVERVGATGVVAIVAVTSADEIVLTEQFRIPVGRSVIDLPAGLAGDAKAYETERLESAARRELEEEVGYTARRFTLLSAAPTSPGLTSEIVTFFRADGLKKTGAGGGIEDENIRVHQVKLASAAAWLRRKIRAGVHIDCKVYAGLYFATQQASRRKS